MAVYLKQSNAAQKLILNILKEMDLFPTIQINFKYS